jgi:GDP-mannose 4,6-dehydratase
MSKKVLITGINGSGASYIAEYLDTLPDIELHGISRWHSNWRDGSSMNLMNVKDHITFHECDLTDMSSVIRSIDEIRPDFIFHMASHANVRLCFINPVAVLNNNISSTINILEAVRILKINPIIHFSGTSEVYGQVKPEDVPIKETHPLDPPNVYAISKLTQEKLMKSYYKSYGIPVILTRAFGYVNPRRPDIFSSAFARQIVEIEKGKRDKLVHGNLDSVRTLIHVKDVAEAYWIASNKCDYAEEYNIGGTDVYTVGEFLEILLKQAKCPIKVEPDPLLIRPVDITLQIPDTTKFRAKTGWAPKYNMEETISFLLEFYRKLIW